MKLLMTYSIMAVVGTMALPTALADDIGICVVPLHPDCQYLKCVGYSYDNPDWTECNLEKVPSDPGFLADIVFGVGYSTLGTAESWAQYVIDQLP